MKRVPLRLGLRWKDNPHESDEGLLAESILQHGFLDPPHYVDVLEGLVEGNGRIKVLWQLKVQVLPNWRGPIPNGVYRDKETGYLVPKNIEIGSDGEWLVPIVFSTGLFSTREEAIAYLFDHNNTGYMSIPGTTAIDAAMAWKVGPYLELLSRGALDHTVTVDEEDYGQMYNELLAKKEKEDQGEEEDNGVAQDTQETDHESESRNLATVKLTFATQEDLEEFEQHTLALQKIFDCSPGMALLEFLRLHNDNF